MKDPLRVFRLSAVLCPVYIGHYVYSGSISNKVLYVFGVRIAQWSTS